MRARFTILMATMMLVVLALMQFRPDLETYIGMTVQTGGGKPYLLLVEPDSFGIYAPNGKDFDGWTPVYDDRSGRVLGTFEIPAAPQTEKPPPPPDPNFIGPLPAPERRIDGLGVFFPTRIALFNIAHPDKSDGVVTIPLNVKWSPEASAELNGHVYAFGAKLDDEKEDSTMMNGVLKAARFDAGNFVELSDAAGGAIHVESPGFWLKAVALDKRIAVLWRAMKHDQTIGTSIEGDRISSDGDVALTFFDGTKFSGETRLVKGLPKGNVCIWQENGMIKCLIQTSLKSAEASAAGANPGTRGRMEIWNIDPHTGEAKLAEAISSEKPTLGLFRYIAAERFKWENHEYILRSTWQKFELWRRTDQGAWELAPNGAGGLPVFTLENKYYTALAFCGFVVLLGAWLAFLRRRHALTLMRKLKPDDLYAPIAARMGAYFVDMLAVVAASFAVSRLLFDQYGEFFPSPLAITWPPLPYVICFLIYFAGSEWLVGGTPGKLLMGLRVVSDAGERPTLVAALVRNLIGIYERQPMMLIVAAPMVVFSPRKQRLGDLLSRTFVVQKQGLDLFIKQRAAAAVRGETLDKLPGESTPDKSDRE